MHYGLNKCKNRLDDNAFLISTGNMQRNWITATLRRQLKICRAVAAKPEELQQIAQLEEAIDGVDAQAEPLAVDFATAQEAST
jgi:hypothetical protein